ncbi:mono/diheme cytochrome c family protein [Pseudomonas nitritireducens]|uniref:Mono/diheme cytochrome c family protein n=1 Tax=Pseudomonas nitroreducens TaxID=46680 RepID=A0A7W7P3R5_PSENT|nr:cytochrome c [Pseudomonas nitritireducens]MBB4865865.1 mono/diheme cytochrome c family protein [Pseudomonas nitritireducens]
MKLILLPLALSLCIGLAQAADLAQQASLERGRYLALLGDCAACHTLDARRPFAGGVALQSPLGPIYASNITPDTRNGIGSYSLAQFDNAMRHGIAADGRQLYPAMPYPSFARLTDQDVGDLYTYFLHGVAADPSENRPPDIVWPLSMRWPLSWWNSLFAGAQAYQADTGKSAQWNRGAYLVQGLGHCGSCHTPRGLAFQEKALDQSDGDYLSGGQLAGWYAAALTGNAGDALRGWTEADLVEFLRNGRNVHTAAFGPMAEAVAHSTQYFNDEDLEAVAVYLRSLAPATPAAPPGADRTSATLAQGAPRSPGEQLYLDNCSACHRSDGQGYARTFPRLAGNSAVTGQSADSLIRIILQGGQVPVTRGAPSGLRMPDFGWRLDDRQVAELSSFLRSAWGYQGTPVQPEDVARLRALN